MQFLTTDRVNADHIDFLPGERVSESSKPARSLWVFTSSSRRWRTDTPLELLQDHEHRRKTVTLALHTHELMCLYNVLVIPDP